MQTVVTSFLFFSAFTSSLFAAPVQHERRQVDSEYPAGRGRRLFGSSFALPAYATYDYVIVGGGTAGLVVATRLAEDLSKSVAVIEADIFYEISNSNLSQIPLLGPVVPVNPHLALILWWTGNSKLHLKRRDFIPHGRPANATPAYDQSTLRRGGPLSLTFARYAMASVSWAQKALTVMGVKQINGLTSGTILGSSYQLLTLSKTFVRKSSETAFLQKNGFKQPNLVYQSVMAQKILFDGLKAKGVSINMGGFPFTSLRICRVGQDMEDHVLGGPSYRVNVLTTSAMANTLFAAQAIQQYLKSNSGVLTAVGADFLAFEKLPKNVTSSMPRSVQSDLAKLPADWPDIEFFPTSAHYGNQINFRTNRPVDRFQYATIAVALGDSLSRSSVSIRPADINTSPSSPLPQVRLYIPELVERTQAANIPIVRFQYDACFQTSLSRYPVGHGSTHTSRLSFRLPAQPLEKFQPLPYRELVPEHSLAANGILKPDRTSFTSEVLPPSSFDLDLTIFAFSLTHNVIPLIYRPFPPRFALRSRCRTHGRKWKTIAEIHFPGRSTTDLKNQHALLIKERPAINAQETSRESSPDSEGDDTGAMSNGGLSNDSIDLPMTGMEPRGADASYENLI
ncbi:GMC oxidoreductase [Zopfia rhizophila CBS 207.26]|uniref:GMC oxidoreductase n=1 Tax=Zopfia rhizophila CBS 207.26 TaxID=1314779 RepID=A0A6A6DZC5_9PEZI|nr:GMC oxidoreductase [Zopfia rhizophila CBS 207.26]